MFTYHIIKFIENLKSLSYALGFFSEFILIIIVSFFIHSHLIDLIVYIFAISINRIINLSLKAHIKDLRPKNPIKFLESETFHHRHNFYGMPSGHSENVFFSISYFMLTISKRITNGVYVYLPWISFCWLVGILTIIERWVFRNHTINQLIVGACTGIVFGFIVVFLRDFCLDYYYALNNSNSNSK
jgi:membrane-associated phospholipid phosphatase